MKDNEPAFSTANVNKKVYHKPQLHVYGDLKDITKAVFLGMGALDGVLFNKTH